MRSRFSGSAPVSRAQDLAADPDHCPPVRIGEGNAVQNVLCAAGLAHPGGAPVGGAQDRAVVANHRPLVGLDETDIDEIEINPNGDLLNGIPVLSPLVWPLSYQFPVHQIRADFQPATVPDTTTHLLVWRRQDFKIKFMQLNDTSMLLVKKMEEDSDITGLGLLEAVAGIIKHPKPEIVLKAGSALLNELKDKQLILGTRP